MKRNKAKVLIFEKSSGIMDNQQLVYRLMIMPEAQLLSTLDYDDEQSLKIEMKTRRDWIKNKRCSCVESEDIRRGRLLLCCEHVKEEIGDKIREIEKSINLKTQVLMFRGLREFHKKIA